MVPSTHAIHRRDRHRARHTATFIGAHRHLPLLRGEFCKLLQPDRRLFRQIGLAFARLVMRERKGICERDAMENMRSQKSRARAFHVLNASE